jgi:hypothetical protein
MNSHALNCSVQLGWQFIHSIDMSLQTSPANLETYGFYWMNYQLLMPRSRQALAGWSILQLLPCQWASLVLLGLATSCGGARISQTNLAHSLIQYLGLEEETCGLHMSLLGHAFPRTYIHDSLTPFNLGCLENPSGPPSVICFRHVMSNWGHAFQGLVPFNLGCFTLKSIQARMS